MHLMFETLNESGTAFGRRLLNKSKMREKAIVIMIMLHVTWTQSASSCKAPALPDVGNVDGS